MNEPAGSDGLPVGTKSNLLSKFLNVPEYPTSAEQLDNLYERLIVLRSQAGDRSAFHELVMRYERRLSYYIRRLVGAEADTFDVLQEVWLKVYRRIGTLRAPEAFRIWLYKIAHDQSVNLLRRRAKEPESIVEQHFPQAEYDPNDEVELREDAAGVHAALAQLSRPHREVLTLRFLESLALEEIAEVVGSGVGTIKSRLHYAKIALRQILESKSDD